MAPLHESLPPESAQVLALRALQFLAGDPARLGRFLALTGVGPAALRAEAAKPAFLAGVLDHLLGDETLLHLFAAESGTDPRDAAAARRRLPGGNSTS
jgi:hypothetical protein